MNDDALNRKRRAAAVCRINREMEEMKAKLQAAEARKKAYVEILEGKTGDEGTLAGVLSKKAKFTYNPFDVEKSKYTQRIFEANNPFMVVITTVDIAMKPAGFPDKVCDGQHMNEEALMTAVRALLDPVALGWMQYKNPRTELGGRHIHGLLVLMLKLLTRPSRHKQRASESPEEAMEDFLVKLGGGNSANDSDQIEAEGDGDGKNATDLAELLTKAKYDLKGLVYDTRLEISKQLVTVLIAEFEWEMLSINKTFQGAGYGVKDGIRNFLRGRRDPIYVQNWDDEKWRYAVMYPQRVIRVIDGRLADVVPECDPAERARLETLLEMKTRDLTGDFIYPERYPDNVYLEGVLHVVERKFDLPSKLGQPLTPEHLLFYEALMRIFIGDRVLTWTKEDVLKNIDLRLAEKQRLIDVALHTTSYGAMIQELLPRPPRDGNVFVPRTLRAPRTSIARVKVHLQGDDVARYVDLLKLSGYAELFKELQRLFGLERAASDPQCGWKPVFTDPDGDLVLVGDNPWEEFCSICRSITIRTNRQGSSS